MGKRRAFEVKARPQDNKSTALNKLLWDLNPRSSRLLDLSPPPQTTRANCHCLDRDGTESRSIVKAGKSMTRGGKKPEFRCSSSGEHGALQEAPCGDRTHDHTLTKRMLCQLS